LSGYLSQKWVMKRTETTVEAQICDKQIILVSPV